MNATMGPHAVQWDLTHEHPEHAGVRTRYYVQNLAGLQYLSNIFTSQNRRLCWLLVIITFEYGSIHKASRNCLYFYFLTSLTSHFFNTSGIEINVRQLKYFSPFVCRLVPGRNTKYIRQGLATIIGYPASTYTVKSPISLNSENNICFSRHT